MRVALIVVQLEVTPSATEDGMRHGVEKALSGNMNASWPTNCGFYFFDSLAGRRGNRVKRVRFVDIPEGS